MLFLSIPSIDLIPAASQKQGVAYELRLDRFDAIDFTVIANFIKAAPGPVLLTVRKVAQGGAFQGSEAERESLIEKLLCLKPPFFDLEADMREEFLERILSTHPKTQFILSHHDLQKVPDDLESIYTKVSKYPAFGYKIAAMVRSSVEALKFLLFAREHPRLSAICMGDDGLFARVLGPVMGNVVNYASCDDTHRTAPGQLTVDDWQQIYRYPTLNHETQIYALIGDPVEKSVGHLYHNAAFQQRQLNALYVKIRVKPEELAEFISLARQVGIRGLSVTMPLKELVIPFVDEIESKEIGAINTLRFDTQSLIGTNTDGLGALEAIEDKIAVSGKTVVVLGAGGAARAIAFEAKKRGAHVWIANRTLARAQALALAIGAIATTLDELPTEYDLIINCCPDPAPIATIKEKCIAMDIVYSKTPTSFITQALAKQCTIVEAKEMFLNQAAKQTLFWLSP